MASSEALRANLLRHAQQRIELDVGIAVGTGDGRAAGQILVHERANDPGFELLFEIDDIMGKIQVLRHALGVIDIVNGAAAMLRRACGLHGRQAALIPQLHGQADDAAVLLQHQRGDYGAVHSAAHSHGYDIRRAAPQQESVRLVGGQ